MSDHLQHELKKEFQLERMILFSDAIFAIAITLLVLEIKVPNINRHIATDAMLSQSLDELMPKLVGFLLSFFFIGLYWTIHHRMFGFVVNYTRKLLWLNLYFLFAVVLMPFSTAFFSEYLLRFLKIPMLIYSGNIVFLGVMNILLWLHITNPKNELVEGLNAEESKYFLIRAILIPVMFIIFSVLYFFANKTIVIYLFLLLPIATRAIRTFFKKKKTL